MVPAMDVMALGRMAVVVDAGRRGHRHVAAG